MMRMTRLMTALALVATLPLAALADQNRAEISDQSYKGGKYAGGGQGHSLAVINNCPREYRAMYRGDLYCRKPAYQVINYRHPSCPKGFRGIYRGNLHCFGRR